MHGGDASKPQVEVLLLNSVLETAAHDLGGLSSALAMHAEALQLGAEGQDLAPVRSIGAEIRTIGRQLRELRGPVGGAALAPTRAGLLSNWMARTLRFGRAHLPRGTALDGEIPESSLSVSDQSAHALTMVLFALLRELRDVLDRSARDAAPGGPLGKPRRRVQLTASPRETDVLVTLELFINDEPASIESSDSAWWSFAHERVSRDGISLSLRTRSVELVAPLASH